MSEAVLELAQAYTASWCSGDPASVADHYAEGGSLTINDGAPAVGRPAIVAAAKAFMDGYPDMVVRMDELRAAGAKAAVYLWTFRGTNSGPGGTGAKVEIAGYEVWRIGDGGLIEASLGFFDQAEWDRQLAADAV